MAGKREKLRLPLKVSEINMRCKCRLKFNIPYVGKSISYSKIGKNQNLTYYKPAVFF
jgi:hypothetical protein